MQPSYRPGKPGFIFLLMRTQAFVIVSLQKKITCCKEFNREDERLYVRDCIINLYEVLRIKESIADDENLYCNFILLSSFYCLH